MSPDRKLMAVDVKEDGNTFTAGSPRALFDMRVFITGSPGASLYDVSNDGQRVLVITPVEESSPSPLTVVLNWTAGLKR